MAPRKLEEIVDERGKALFGRSVRLALALKILELDTPVFLSQLHQDGLDRFALSALQQELGRLKNEGLLQSVRTPSERRVYYLRTDSQWWLVFAAAGSAAADEHANQAVEGEKVADA